jgi:cell division protease FtsH
MSTALQSPDLRAAIGTASLLGAESDVAKARESSRQQRLRRLALVLLVTVLYVTIRALLGNPVHPSIPSINWENPLLPAIFLTLVIGLGMGAPILLSGRSPHTLYRSEDIGITLADVAGADAVKDEVVRSLNLFLANKTFATEMGGTPRRGLLFSGTPGTGKTYIAKAMAGTAGVPFVFVSATAFQSMYYGATARKIRSYFRSLRKIARKEGGAIGFIEEFDAVGLARTGAGPNSGQGVSGVVNELLVQMQSFDEPTLAARLQAWVIERVNAWLPPQRRLKRPQRTPANIILIAATNRAADLDPALLRAGRFDRTITFDLPVRRERQQIAAYYLNRKSHDVSVTPEEVAQVSAGFSPVEIEQLLDEALVCALRAGRRVMKMKDITEAKLIISVGISRDGEYTTGERWRVAVHEAGHGIASLLVGHDVGLVSILKRASALGITTHSTSEEMHLHTRAHLEGYLQIALAGMVAEELECGDFSSGASSDLSSATATACQMIGSLGMGESLLSLDAAGGPLSGNLVDKVLADPASRTAANLLLTEARERVRELLAARRGPLRRAAQALLDKDEISGTELAQILAGQLAGS